jgi:hypothetical protein
MQKNKFLIGALALVFVVSSGCQEENDLVSQDNNLAPEVKPLLKGGPNPRPQAWVDCELFDGVVTPATFNPQSDPFDELYAGGNGFKDGVPLVSESKPGDQDYNGGRWHKNVLRAGVDPNKYVNANACSVEDLDLNDFQSTGDYFECPLLPRRGNN